MEWPIYFSARAEPDKILSELNNFRRITNINQKFNHAGPVNKNK
jgi:hypothetical protein